MNKRSTLPELIDLGPSYYSQNEYRDCLVQLGRIGKYLGGDRATFWALDQLDNKPQSILDVGCGGGQLTIELAKRYPDAIVQGIDLSQEAIHFATEQLNKTPSIKNLDFSVPNTPELTFAPKSFDIVTTTLVCHHLTDLDLIDFLKRSVLVAKEAVIINDLHRHFAASCSFSIIAPLFFRNRLIFHDGLLSIKKGFKRRDWEYYLKSAGIPKAAFSISWHFPFRWMIIIYPGKM